MRACGAISTGPPRCGISGRTPTLDNVIDAHVARLRKKIDAETAVKLIHTVRGVGFVVREEAA